MTEKHQNKNDNRLSRILLEDESAGWLSPADLIRQSHEFVAGDDPLECNNCFEFLTGFLRLLTDHRDFNIRQGQGGEAEIVPVTGNTIQSTPKVVTRETKWSEFWQGVMASRSRVGLNSSGTSGDQKLVVHYVKSLTRAVRLGPERNDDVWGLAFHPASFAGLQVLFQALANCNPIIRLIGKPPREVHDLIDRHGITHLSATPTFLRMFHSGSAAHPGLRRLNISGEQVDLRLVEQTRRMFPNATVRNLYASTEAGSLLTSDGELFTVPERLAGKIGIDDGELVLHRSLLAEENTPAAGQGFFRTGDQVEVVQLEPLTFRFLARESRVINVGGRKVVPERVESAVNEIEGVVDSVAWGQTNTVSGSLVCCDVVLAEHVRPDEAELKRILRERLEPHEVPRVIRFVKELELTATGKKKRVARSEGQEAREE